VDVADTRRPCERFEGTASVANGLDHAVGFNRFIAVNFDVVDFNAVDFRRD
jgi:hypothetical protein